MPQKICKGCGGITNTCFCDWFSHPPDYEPRRCYLRLDGGRWVKGCGWDSLDDGKYGKKFYSSLLNNKSRVNAAIHEVHEELLAMDDDEFHEVVAEHEDGDIARMLLETGALSESK